MRKLALVMALLLLLTSCGFQDDEKASEEDKKTKEISKTDEKTGEDEDAKTNNGSADDSDLDDSRVVMNQITFEDVKNKSQYDGFTDSQVNDLNSRGFVVLEQNTDRQIVQKYHIPYEMANYSDRPIFISSDAVLNAFSIFYNGSIMKYELSEFYLTSAEMSNRLSSKLLDEYNNASERMLQKQLEKALAYSFTASRLFFNEVEDIDLASIYSHDVAGKYNSELKKFNNLKSQIPEDVMKMSNEEYDKVIAAKGISESNLFGYDIDYSQFKPRGHYDSGPSLRNYFLGQMWLSNPGFELEGKNSESKKIALILASIMNEDKYLKDLWTRVYDVTAYFSSTSDDLNILDLEPIVEDVLKYKEVKFLGINDEGIMREVDKAIAELREPKIKPVTFEGSEHNLSTKKQFRFMGQRYNGDQYIFTKLSNPPVKPEVSSFEFFDVLGSKESHEIAEKLLHSSERWEEYPERLEEVKKDFKENKNDFYTDDLYHAYLEALELTLNNKVDRSSPNVPNFMKVPEYNLLKINSTLGAFAQLKHANVLYSKQMMAEMGAPEEKISPHYLEPNVKLYEQLSKMIDEAIVKLDKFGVAGEEDAYARNSLKELSKTLKLFIRVSNKELDGEDLTDEELLALGRFGGMVDSMFNEYVYVGSKYGFELSDPAFGQPLISDIATVDDSYLELGIGLPLEMYVLVEQNGQKVLAKGVIFSSYEFYS